MKRCHSAHTLLILSGGCHLTCNLKPNENTNYLLISSLFGLISFRNSCRCFVLIFFCLLCAFEMVGVERKYSNDSFALCFLKLTIVIAGRYHLISAGNSHLQSHSRFVSICLATSENRKIKQRQNMDNKKYKNSFDANNLLFYCYFSSFYKSRNIPSQMTHQNKMRQHPTSMYLLIHVYVQRMNTHKCKYIYALAHTGRYILLQLHTVTCI